MFNFYGDLTTDEYINDQLIWGDYGDYAEDVWSDEDWDMSEDEAESYWHGASEDAAMEAGLFGWDA